MHHAFSSPPPVIPPPPPRIPSHSSPFPPFSHRLSTVPPQNSHFPLFSRGDSPSALQNLRDSAIDTRRPAYTIRSATEQWSVVWLQPGTLQRGMVPGFRSGCRFLTTGGDAANPFVCAPRACWAGASGLLRRHAVLEKWGTLYVGWIAGMCDLHERLERFWLTLGRLLSVVGCRFCFHWSFFADDRLVGCCGSRWQERRMDPH